MPHIERMGKMEKTEEIVEKIAKKSGKPAAEIQTLIEKKKDKFSGLLTDSGAAFMIAKELDVRLELEQMPNEQLKISELKNGMNNTDLIIRVKQIFTPKQFSKAGRSGILQNIIAGDETGEIRLTIWHKDVDKLAQMKVDKNTILKLRNCYVTEWQDKLQLNLSYNGDFSVIDSSESIPEFPVQLMKINSLKSDLQNVDLIARVNRIYETRTFQKEGKEGSLISFELIDDTGKIRTTAWNELVQEIQKLKENDLVKIEGAYTKEGLQEKVELQLGWQARVLKDPNGIEMPNKDLLSVKN